MIEKLNRLFTSKKDLIEDWFRNKSKQIPLPLYASVDIRNSHHKIAVVDTNAFPAGFNNLCPYYHRMLAAAFRDYIERRHPGTTRILLIPEDHTRNTFYLENVKVLTEQLTQAGFQVRLGSANPKINGKIQLEAVSGSIQIYSLKTHDKKLTAGNFIPDIVVSNNDFSSGIPDILRNIEQPLTPPVNLGWHLRLKSDHFRIMNSLIRQFAELVDIDPWLISTRINSIENIEFTEQEHRNQLADMVDKEIEFISQEYRRRGIPDKPAVFIKHNSGTYGMAVMNVESGDNVRHANRRTREKMKMGKGRLKAGRFFIQEGIPTKDHIEGCPMEPVIYLVGCTAVGGFYRIHCSRTENQNLNVKGMEFRKLCFHQVAERHPERLDDSCEDSTALLSVYGNLARLAALAMGIEIQNLPGENMAGRNLEECR